MLRLQPQRRLLLAGTALTHRARAGELMCVGCGTGGILGWEPPSLVPISLGGAFPLLVPALLCPEAEQLAA